ncbi:MAG: hypothetical protein ABSD08_19765 [Xanthobacteraceae bacterium]|jgi:hypothetical protein
MKKSNPLVTITRRDSIRLLAVTPAVASNAVLANLFSGAAWAAALMPGADAAHLGQGSAGVPRNLAKLAAEHFEPLVGGSFTVGEDEVTLRNVRRRLNTGSRFREQFSVVFNAPRNSSILSETLPVSHPAIGRHDLLVTQILDGVDSTALEICFG